MRIEGITLREWENLSHRQQKLTPGHRLCSGCSHSVIVKQILLAVPEGVGLVACCATGCLEVSTTLYPHNAWNVPCIHNAFENVAATAAGVEAALQSLRRKGKIRKEIKIVTFAGDGGTHDIGLQSLSGALERGHHVVHACLDNEAYMNTGIQRSSATPLGASTTTAPAGRVVCGKVEPKKDICLIVAAHKIPYVAQCSPSHPADLIRKAKKAFQAKGPAFLNIISPCPVGWRFHESEGVEVSQLAVETCYWPLYEVEGGKWWLTYRPEKKIPIVDWLKKQGRFKHLLKEENQPVIDAIQKDVDSRWEELLFRTGG